jgi:putative ABC transport system substrate-binding protein
MNRRTFITIVGSAAMLPVAARAQQAAMPVVGYFGLTSPEMGASTVVLKGLSETGYVEGRNVAIEYRWAAGRNDQLQALAADLVGRKVNVIVTDGGTPVALAAKAATTGIPIIFVIGNDPVEAGLVTSLNRPGGNVTGVSFLTAELGAKRLEILLELAPQATTVAYLVDPRNVAVKELTDKAFAAGQALGRQIIVLEARSELDFEAAFATLVQRRAGAMVVGTNALFTGNRDKLLALTAHYKIPAIYAYRDYTTVGGLISYGASLVDAYRQAGVYVGRILKGEKPANLPVMQPTKFELVINLKTAKALGLTVPLALLTRADEVIE